MKRIFSTIAIFCLLLTIFSVGKAQESVNTVSYKVTYNTSTQVYTAWVVPNYNVPNSNNTGTTEKGATAQFSLIVPKDFIISNITDVNGTWEKSPLKLGPGQAGQDWAAFSLDPNYNYYVIGKNPSETDYGVFQNGQAVALFTFKGSSCLGPVAALPPTSAFIAAADTKYSLGVANSFYSRSGQPAGGNQNPLEQFKNVVGGPASCSLVVATPNTGTTQAGMPVITTVLGNDTNNSNQATIANSTITIAQPPTNGTVVVNADGTIKYTPNSGYVGQDCYIYKLCDKTIVTDCATASVCINVTSIQTTDISISKTVSSQTVSLNDVITYTIKVKNEGSVVGTNIIVKDSMSVGLVVQTSQGTHGTFSNTVWTIPSLDPGATATLVITAKVTVEGISYNTAKLVSLDQTDLNNQNNISSVCSTVPIQLCNGSRIELSVPSTYTDVKWYKDGVMVSNGNTYIASQSGSYTTSASNNTCPSSGCCPIIIVVTECCQTNICVPITITKKIK
jgi:uncharacterized repeat protein (TIGR01451 family)